MPGNFFHRGDLRMSYVKCFVSLSNADAQKQEAPRTNFFDNDVLAADWRTREDRPGRGVFQCIGLFRPGTTERKKESVAAVPFIVVDLDLPKIFEPRDAVLACLRELALPPSEIRDSGNGLHAIWHLKEPLVDEPGMAQAETVMKALVRLLAGDPAVTHRAALLRCVDTHNSKFGEWKRCHVIN